MRTKAYTALITKWYVTEIFSDALPSAEALKFELRRYNKKILAKNRMKLSTNESLHCCDYQMVCDRKFFGCFTPGGNPQSSSYDVTASFDVTARMTS